MKKANIYYEGKEITSIEFDRSNQLVTSDGLVLWTKFFLKDEEVGYFNGNHSYVIICQQL